MHTLRVDLQEGFTGQEVVVRIAGRERYRESVKTRLQTGLAALVEFSVPTGQLDLEIELAQSHEVRRIPLAIERDTYVCVSLDSRSALTHTVAHEPPGYL